MAAVLAMSGLAAVAHAQAAPESMEEAHLLDVSTTNPGAVRFAVIGDFGAGQFDPLDAEGQVSQLVHGLDPDFVITVGDNNYPFGESSTIDANVGLYYADYIHPYTGDFGPGGDENRFFPALGNHDWFYLATAEGIALGATVPLAHTNYFTLPGNERYYEFQGGPAHLFCVDSDPNEPDGRSASSIQGQWAKARLAASTAPFQLAYMHHPPYSSGVHGSDPVMQWPWLAWGADAVFAGHEHFYERLFVDGVPYFIVGTGGNPTLYPFVGALTESDLRYNLGFGAVLVEGDERAMRVRFLGVEGGVHDDYTILPGVGRTPNQETLVPKLSDWKFWDRDTTPGANWMGTGFDDSLWACGVAQFGYGDGDESTLIDPGRNPLNKMTAAFFRKEFSAARTSRYRRLVLRTKRDDGIRVFLNNQEIHRVNLPFGIIEDGAKAVWPAIAPDESTFFETHIDPALLRDGTNLLSVSVHQVHEVSSDLSFDLELLGAW